MKNIFKYGLFLALPLFMACSEDTVEYVPAEPVAADCPTVEFSASNPTVVEANPAAPEIAFVVTRKDASSAAEYSLNILENEGESFSVPAKVSFASGEKEAVVRVSVNAGAKTLVPLRLTVGLDDKDVNPYTPGFKTYTVDITLCTWNVYAQAMWYDDFWTGETWEVEVEYSPDMDMYRIKSVFEEGYNLFFKINKETGVVTLCNSDGSATTKWTTGIVHSSYGAITANDSGLMYIEDEDGPYIQFAFKWTVSAGSFGVYACYLIF